MSGGIVLIQPQRAPDWLDIRSAVALAVDAFCHEHGISGPNNRRELFLEIATQAGQMAEEIRA